MQKLSVCPHQAIINLTGSGIPQINKINEEKRAIMDQLEDAERQLKKRDEENARLRRELDMLRDEVRPCAPNKSCDVSPIRASVSSSYSTHYSVTSPSAYCKRSWHLSLQAAYHDKGKGPVPQRLP